MELNKDNIVETRVIWKLEKNYVVTEKKGNKVILNDTASIVWRKIDGFKTIQDIINDMIDEYGDKNPADYIEQITLKSISMFMNENLIALKEADLLGEWY